MKASTVLVVLASLVGNSLAAPAGASMGQAQQRDTALQALGSHTGDVKLGERDIQVLGALMQGMAKRDAAATPTSTLDLSAIINAVTLGKLDVKALISAIINAVKTGNIDGVLQLLKGAGIDLTNGGQSGGGSDILQAIYHLLGLKNITGPLADTVGDTIKGVTGGAGGAGGLGGLTDTVGNVVKGVTDTVDGTVKGVTGGAGGLGGLTDAVGNAVKGVTDTVDDTVKGVTGTADSATNPGAANGGNGGGLLSGVGRLVGGLGL